MLEMDHGGNIFELARARGVHFRELIDFSASTNPLGLPEDTAGIIARNIDCLTHYPEDRNPKLLTALSAYSGARPPEILIGNGATELLYFTLRFLEPQRVLLPLPTFSEFSRACRILEVPFDSFPLIHACQGRWEFDWKGLIEQLNQRTHDLVIFVNPNNPTGAVLDHETLTGILDSAHQAGTRILMDESFIDFVAEPTLVPLSRRYESLFVLRSLTKFYSMPGLRLGYLVAHHRWISRMIEHREPWQVNNLAQLLGEAFLNLPHYAEATRSLVEQERTHLVQQLQKFKGLTVFPSRCNFMLIQLETSRGSVDTLCKHCLEHRIIIRNCSGWPGAPPNCFRVAVRSADDNQMLIDALREFL